MSELFADSFYFIARLVPEDQWHSAACAYHVPTHSRLVTTEYLLVELADALCDSPQRARAGEFIQRLQTASDLTIVSGSRELLSNGLQLYVSRRDKSWSLTDCISFVVMRARGISDALTGDRHFEQAGFNPLLKQ